MIIPPHRMDLKDPDLDRLSQSSSKSSDRWHTIGMGMGDTLYRVCREKNYRVDGDGVPLHHRGGRGTDRLRWMETSVVPFAYGFNRLRVSNFFFDFGK